MNLKVEKTPLEGVLVLEPKAFRDDRGYLAETYHQDTYKAVGVTCGFVQDNQSYSTKGVLRGLHAQLRRSQAKLVRAVTGEIFDVAVDARPGSTTFGKWYGTTLTGENLRQLFIPAGFLHGFCVLSETAVVHYKCSDIYVPDDQAGVKWNDLDLAIEWPVKNPRLSEKDLLLPSWQEMKGKWK